MHRVHRGGRATRQQCESGVVEGGQSCTVGAAPTEGGHALRPLGGSFEARVWRVRSIVLCGRRRRTAHQRRRKCSVRSDARWLHRSANEEILRVSKQLLTRRRHSSPAKRSRTPGGRSIRESSEQPEGMTNARGRPLASAGVCRGARHQRRRGCAGGRRRPRLANESRAASAPPVGGPAHAPVRRKAPARPFAPNSTNYCSASKGTVTSQFFLTWPALPVEVSRP